MQFHFHLFLTFSCFLQCELGILEKFMTKEKKNLRPMLSLIIIFLIMLGLSVANIKTNIVQRHMYFGLYLEAITDMK